MADNVFRFRSVKWGDPEQKLKMIPDGRGQAAQAAAGAMECAAIIFAFAAAVAGGLLVF